MRGERMRRQPKDFLIVIRVTVKPNGTLKTQIQSYYEDIPGDLLKDPLRVRVGDRIGWLIQVLLPGDGVWRSMPYDLGFSSPTFFGVTSLNVPSGGASPFLTVLAVQEKISYRLKVPEVGCVFDPDIQSGSDTAPFPIDTEAVTPVAAYKILWNLKTNKMQYAGSDGKLHDLPLTVSVGDVVTFEATNYSGDLADFAISFPKPNLWASPFSYDVFEFDADDKTPNLVTPNPVADDSDSGATFKFNASIIDNGDWKESTGNPIKMG
jgi:hypothetical protein